MRLAGLKVQGVPVGEPAFTAHQLGVKTAKCVSKINKIVSKLQTRSIHALWVATWFSNMTLLHHWLQLCSPDDTLACASDMDAALTKAGEAAVPALALADPLSRCRFAQPARLKGAGFRACTVVRHAAFLGSVEQALPRFVDKPGEPGFSPACASALGVGSFEPGGQRYAALIVHSARGGGVSVSAQIVSSWQHLQAKVGITQQDVLDGTGTSLLHAPCHMLGGGLKQMQRLITKQVENHTHTQLHAQFLALPAGDMRRSAWMHVDRFASQWVAGYMAEHECSNLEWEFGTGWYMGLPLPSLAAMVGKPIAGTGQFVDAHGRYLTSVNVAGADWTTCHDGFLAAVRDDLIDCGINTRTEVVGLFRSAMGCVHGRRAFDRASWRDRRGSVPDAIASFALDGEPPRDHLLELKFIRYCPSNYPVYRGGDSAGGAVARRAAKIPGEYRNKARKLDEKYSGQYEGDIGPVEQRLRVLGPVQPMVVGAFGEMNTFMHSLLRAAAAVGGEKHWARMRCASPSAAAAVMAQVLRRSWGMTAFRANARVLIRRLGLCDAPAGQAAAASLFVRRSMRRRRDYACEMHSGGDRGVVAY